jgi:NAD(P)-dependent dehydrogenase (short-subunit alcohol dehydrogenase family)
VDFGEEKPSFAVAEETLKTNFDSTVDFIKQFLPLLAKDGRVVVVSSVMGALKEQGESIRHKL